MVPSHSDDVWRSLFLWISKPSAYNKHVGTTEIVCIDHNQSPNPLDAIDIFFKSNQLKKVDSYSAAKLVLKTFLSNQELTYDDDLKSVSLRQGKWIIIRFMVPKNGVFHVNNIDLINCDFDDGKLDFLMSAHDSALALLNSYTISFAEYGVSFDFKNKDSKELIRLRDLFFSKLDKWIENNHSKSSSCGSLNLISQEEYFILYNNLKKKYCDSIRKIWNECTDPDKFIHEDIAIATYLMLIWKRQKQTFVDLGCGNGLLVHILSEEGHQGFGVDVRSRKIWNSYTPSTVLKEETIVPSPQYTFPGINWIIGNHSDELTPWIPIIALLSSEDTNFFLLPCCAYEFSGVKYKRTNSSLSQYMDYLNYVENLTIECGFNVCRDRLKIPSTKRICFVSNGRFSHVESKIDLVNDIINRRNAHSESANQPDKHNWLTDFKPRETIEKVRNCTQLNKTVVSNLLLKIANVLLDGTDSSEWNAGTPTELSFLAKNLDQQDRLHLKNECGGLQTLLRNHHFIFKLDNGKVTFRKPEIKKDKPKSWKVKSCWFFNNHPQSCPLEDGDCSFNHVKE